MKNSAFLLSELVLDKRNDRGDFRLPKWLKREIRKDCQLRGWSISRYFLAATLDYYERNNNGAEHKVRSR